MKISVKTKSGEPVEISQDYVALFESVYGDIKKPTEVFIYGSEGRRVLVISPVLQA